MISSQLSILGFFALFLRGCSLLAVPTGIKAVDGFDVRQYVGCWHEVARLDNRFQQGLEQVTATYSLQKDGSIRVENAGWNSQKRQYSVIVGKAKFVSRQDTGHLKVSFWGPFYSSYIIFYLEADYSVAIVCGARRDLCWILARKPTLPAKDLAKYLKIAQDNGFAVEKFIYSQNNVPTTAESGAYSS